MAPFRTACLIALPFVAQVALAQTPPLSGPPSSQLTAALTKLKQGGDPLAKQLYTQLRDTTAQIQLEAQRPVINVDLFSALIKKADGLQAQFRSRQSDILLQALKGLPEGDRAAFLKAVGLTGTRAAVAPAH